MQACRPRYERLAPRDRPQQGRGCGSQPSSCDWTHALDSVETSGAADFLTSLGDDALRRMQLQQLIDQPLGVDALDEKPGGARFFDRVTPIRALLHR
jgi:hypothetical protein